jgi:hypothetical protein
MGTIQRSISMNPVEPAPFSLRVVSGISTSILVTLFDRYGSPVKQDLAMQMQLTSRSSGRVTSYAMPATDVVNGKAMSTIPAGDLTDSNGYVVNVYGTVAGGAELLATGILRLVSGPGIDQAPDDIIDTIPLTVQFGQPLSITVKLWQDVGKTIPYNLDTTPVVAQLYLDRTSTTALMIFSQTRLGLNELELALTGEQTQTLPPSCWWDLRATVATGMTTLAQGEVTVIGSVVTGGIIT